MFIMHQILEKIHVKDRDTPPLHRFWNCLHIEQHHIFGIFSFQLNTHFQAGQASSGISSRSLTLVRRKLDFIFSLIGLILLTQSRTPATKTYDRERFGRFFVTHILKVDSRCMKRQKQKKRTLKQWDTDL